jgi:hypothetical protein
MTESEQPRPGFRTNEQQTGATWHLPSAHALCTGWASVHEVHVASALGPCSQCQVGRTSQGRLGAVLCIWWELMYEVLSGLVVSVGVGLGS